MPNQAATAPDPAVVLDELERIAASACFRKAPRCLRLLRYLTAETLAGRAPDLKEYVIGLAVMDRPESFDPRNDPVVRLEARRLRLKLAEYYQSEGSKDAIVIDLPKGGYVPEFRVPIAPAADTAPMPVPLKRRFSKTYAVAAGAAVLLAVAAGIWINSRKKAPAVIVRPSIAVIGFRSAGKSPGNTWIPSAFSEALSFDLAAGQQLRTIPLDNVAHMRAELGVQPQTTYAVELLQRMRRNLGSDYVVAGSLSEQANQLQANLIVTDARTGQQLTAIRANAQQNDVMALAQISAARVRAVLGVRSSAGSLPMFDERALEPYARGMERLRQGDALGARAYLEQAASDSPSNPFVYSALAAALAGIGLDKRAEQEAKKALDSSTELGRVEQLEMEARYATMARDWERAIRVYQALFTLFPDDLEYGLSLAFAENRGGQAKQVFTVLKSLRSLPSPLGDDPRIDLTDAQAAGALSDFKRTEEQARAAAENAKARGARLLYAKARLLQSGAMDTSGQIGAEVRAEARNICAQLGDRSCVAAAYRMEANNKAMAGELVAADQIYSATLKIANEIGNRLEQLNALNGFAYTTVREGDLPAAEAYLRRAVAVATEMGAQKSYQMSLGLADVLAEEGRLAEARNLIADAGKTANQVSEQNGIAHAQSALAHVLALENRFSEANTKYLAAVATLHAVNDAYDLRDTLLDFEDVQLEANDVSNARKSFEEARRLSQRTGEPLTPELELPFAQLSLAEGRLPDAVAHARSALEWCAKSGRQGDRLRAAAVLMRASLRQHRSADALAVLAPVPAPDANHLPPRSVVEFQIARASVLAKVGRRAEAMRILDEAVKLAARAGIPQLQERAAQARKSLPPAS